VIIKENMGRHRRKNRNFHEYRHAKASL